jgi:hypothetical protein
MLLRRLHPTRFDGNRNGSYGHPAATAKVVGVLMDKDRDECGVAVGASALIAFFLG